MSSGRARKPQTESPMRVGRARLRVVAIGFAVAFSSVALRLVDLARQPGTEGAAGGMLSMSAKAAPPVAAMDPRHGGRADIVDRNGVVLATNLRVPGIYADPSLLADKSLAARRLAAVLAGVDADDLARRFDSARRFAWVKHRITPEEQKAVLELGLPGVGFQMAEHRVYPKERLASHVIGYVDIDGRGRAGVERSLEQRLADGAAPVVLSLDTRIQQVARDELLRGSQEFQAIGGNAMVFDRVTGELLAMVSLPDFDPNRIGKVDGKEYLNRNTGEAYELGSVFKILTIAMALDSGKVSIADRFDATGKLQIGRFRIGDDHAKNRWLSVSEIFKYSSNIGTARMAFAAGGGQPLEAFFRRLGFYAPPQIEIAEVVRPLTPKKWPDVTVATTSFGHGISVTPLQFVEAVGGIVGDGNRVAPTLLRRVPGAPIVRTATVTPRTADLMRYLMWLTVQDGTGTRAKLDAYTVGGKTGTAEKAVGGRYIHDKVLASFIGAFPINDPRYLVFASLDEPQGNEATYGFRTGGWTAAPIVARIVDRIGPILGVAPTPPEVADAMHARLLQLGGSVSGGGTKAVRGQVEETAFATGDALR